MGKYSPKSGRAKMEKVVCDKCNKDCEVPFKPIGNKPVYCSDCFEKFGEKRFDRKGKGPGWGKRDSDRSNRRDSDSERRDYRRDSRDTQMHSATCDECGNTCEVPFRPTQGKPIFCNNCFRKRNDGDAPRRDNRRDDRQGNSRPRYRDNRSRDKEMFGAVCSECGKDCKVPFRPSSNKPVYCSDCFEEKERIVENKGTNYEGKSKDMKQLRERIDGMNKKIDMMMEMLETMGQRNNKSKKPEDKKLKNKKIKDEKEAKKPKKTIKKKE